MKVRELVRAAQFGEPVDLQTVWRCTTCRACEASCPHGIPIVDAVLKLRREAWKVRGEPAALSNVLWGIHQDGNPLRLPPSQRMAWARDLNIGTTEKTDEILLYVGCTASYDRRAQKITKALVKVLRRAGVLFGVLGEEEPCCGEAAKMAGHRAYFEEVARDAIRKIQATQVKTVVTVSPHCYDVMKRDYPGLGAEFTVLHGTEYVAELIRQGRLAFTKPVPRTVTYHDPCYLSRGHGVIEPPREILKAIPKLRLVEMADHGTLTWCCGGGGGRAYQESLPNERLADVRVRQADAVRAEVLAAACPLCVTHFEDSAKVGGSTLQVMDVMELAAQALGENPKI